MATSFKQIDVKTPQQRQFIDSLLEQLSPDVLSRLMGDEEAFRERFQRTTAEPAMRQFQEDIIPQLQERFAAMGSRGGDAEALQLSTAGTRLSSELSRLLEESLGQETNQQRSLFSNLANLGISTDVFQPVAFNKTSRNPFSSFLGDLGQSLSSGLTGGLSDIISGFFKKGM